MEKNKEEGGDFFVCLFLFCNERETKTIKQEIGVWKGEWGIWVFFLLLLGNKNKKRNWDFYTHTKPRWSNFVVGGNTPFTETSTHQKERERYKNKKKKMKTQTRKSMKE